MILKRNEERRVEPMKDDLTKLTLETLEYRKKQLEWKAGQMERLLSGRDKSLLPLMRDEKGNYSEEKCRALAEELTEALDQHLRAQDVPAEQRDQPLSDFPPALAEDVRPFYLSFFYCLLRLAENPPPWRFPFKGTFGNLLAMSRDLGQYREKEKFCLDAAFPHRVWSSEVWYWMDRLREDFTGVPAKDTVSEEELDAARERFPDEVAMAEMDACMVLQEKEDPKGWGIDEEDEDEWEKEERERKKQETEKWLREFPDKEVFCREYLNWQKSYFDLYAWSWLEDQVETMLDVYLYQEGSSSFLADDTYFSAYALLDRAVKQLRELLDGED